MSALAIMLGGCIAMNTPGDLALESVELTDWRDQPELPGPGASPLMGLVSKRDLLLMGESVTGGEKPSRPTLKIEFSSAINLARFAIENSWNLGNTTSFCDRQETFTDLAFPDVFWRGELLDRLEPDPIGPKRVDERIIYYFFLDVAREKMVPSKPPIGAYDLRQAPEDVCFYLRGGNHIGGYWSNTVKVPREVIASALQHRAR